MTQFLLFIFLLALIGYLAYLYDSYALGKATEEADYNYYEEQRRHREDQYRARQTVSTLGLDEVRQRNTIVAQTTPQVVRRTPTIVSKPAYKERDSDTEDVLLVTTSHRGVDAPTDYINTTNSTESSRSNYCTTQDTPTSRSSYDSCSSSSDSSSSSSSYDSSSSSSSDSYSSY